MSQQANITAFDGASTPVSHTFFGEGISVLNGESIAVWREQNAALPYEAQGVITMKKRKLPSGIIRVACRVEIPVMESITGQNAAGYTAAPKIAYVDTDESVGYFNTRGTPTSRRIVKQLASNVRNNLSTTTPVITAGPLAELFDMLVMPT
jgi:hypothetical protein